MTLPSLNLGVGLAYAAEITNKFGIHISDIHEAKKAQELVNSQGGEWGYVTFAINSNDRQVAKWQERFNELNSRKLIPIVRIATFPNGANWEKPTDGDPKDWAKFLNSLYWPTKKRLVVLYNEPNHANEWGGSVDPAGFARHVSEMITEIKKNNPDFVVLPPGFDASAPQRPPQFMDQVMFMDEMEKAVSGIFSQFDGWTSHSYPNPGFAGKPTDTGRGTVSGYKWELDLLRNRYKVQKDMPVYITETGWPYRNKDHDTIKLEEEKAAEYIKYAYENIWLPDDRVKAVTPFMLVYRSPVFSHFSWLREDDSETLLFSTVKEITKKAGEPERESKAVITAVSVPDQLQRDHEEVATIIFKNTGNTIWNAVDQSSLAAFDPEQIVIRNNFSITDTNTRVLPGQTYVFRFTMATKSEKNRAPLTLQMQHDGEFFGEKLYIPIKIYQEPKLTFKVTNPPERTISNVKIAFSKGTDTDKLESKSIPTDGNLGTYTSHLFVPEQRVMVTIETPNRDPIVTSVLLQEGENILEITLPKEKSLWERFLNFSNNLFVRSV